MMYIDENRFAPVLTSYAIDSIQVGDQFQSAYYSDDVVTVLHLSNNNNLVLLRKCDRMYPYSDGLVVVRRPDLHSYMRDRRFVKTSYECFSLDFILDQPKAYYWFFDSGFNLMVPDEFNYYVSYNGAEDNHNDIDLAAEAAKLGVTLCCLSRGWRSSYLVRNQAENTLLQLSLPEIDFSKQNSTIKLENGMRTYIKYLFNGMIS